MSTATHIPGNVTTVMFDLGGVIVDLAPHDTLHAFAELSGKPMDEILRAYHHEPAFHAYETGRIGDDEFRDRVREVFSIQADDAAIDRCWNAMLKGIPAQQLAMLRRLKRHFTTLALSNTNAIHLAYINNQVLRGSLDTYFNHAYYSHVIGLRKPDTAIYQYVLKKHALLPQQVLFLDDSLPNIECAKKLGLETMLVSSLASVTDLFNAYE